MKTHFFHEYDKYCKEKKIAQAKDSYLSRGDKKNICEYDQE